MWLRWIANTINECWTDGKGIGTTGKGYTIFFSPLGENNIHMHKWYDTMIQGVYVHEGEESARTVCEYMNEGARTHDTSCETLNYNFVSTAHK